MTDKRQAGSAPYQVMPPLSAEEYAALRADIAEHGVRVPIDVDENGTILDGHHRQAIATELGTDCPTRVVAGLTDDRKRLHAFAVNLQRRSLDREQRRALIIAELTHDPMRSDRAIGRRLGVDGKTVGSVRRELAEAETQRVEQAERERREARDQDVAQIRELIAAAGGRDRRRWAAWIVSHDPNVARSVLDGGVASLADAAGLVCARFGCAELACRHHSPGLDVETAEFPQLPVPPLRRLGPYRVHPIVDLFPLVDDEWFAEIAADIAARGLLHPITLTHDGATLVDGRIRYLACQTTGTEPTYERLPEDYDEEQITHYILATNGNRVSLTPSQVAAAYALADSLPRSSTRAHHSQQPSNDARTRDDSNADANPRAHEHARRQPT
jgi:ParB-like chromosome segregation protein Spo0J